MAGGLSRASPRVRAVALAAAFVGLSVMSLGHPVGAPAATPGPHDLTFYLHNATTGRTVNGISSTYLFDTERTFGVASNATSTQQVRQDWYLYPALAADLPMNGSIRAHIYVDVSGTSPNLNPTLEVWERTAAGVETLVTSKNLANTPWWNTPHDLAIAMDPVQHTFAAGSSIRIILDLVAGTRTATIWWNASWVPSHVIVPADDFAQPAGLSFLDSSGTPRASFDPLAADPTVHAEVTVRDPLGGYDIAWVNLTIVAPDGTVVVDNGSMVWIAGAPIDLITTWRYVWDYSGFAPGTYDARVWVLDNSGSDYWSANFDVGPYGAYLDGVFTIGILPLTVYLRVSDLADLPLEGAVVEASVGGTLVASAATDPAGLAELRVFAGTYEVRAVWQQVLVAAKSLTFSGNVTATNPIPFPADVASPTIAVHDADGFPLAGASVLLRHPNGTLLPPISSDRSGLVNLTQVPAGLWAGRISWRGVVVFEDDLALGGTRTTVATAVYRVTVEVKDGRGGTLAGAFVSARDASGLVFDADLSDRSGQVLLRLPAGEYTVRVAVRTTTLGTPYEAQKEVHVTVDISKTIRVTFLDLPITLTNTVVFQLSVILALFGVFVATLTYRLWRKVRRLEGKPAGTGFLGAATGLVVGSAKGLARSVRRLAPRRAPSPEKKDDDGKSAG